jgi:hypothetical protein
MGANPKLEQLKTTLETLRSQALTSGLSKDEIGFLTNIIEKDDNETFTTMLKQGEPVIANQAYNPLLMMDSLAKLTHTKEAGTNLFSPVPSLAIDTFITDLDKINKLMDYADYLESVYEKMYPTIPNEEFMGSINTLPPTNTDENKNKPEILNVLQASYRHILKTAMDIAENPKEGNSENLKRHIREKHQVMRSGFEFAANPQSALNNLNNNNITSTEEIKEKTKEKDSIINRQIGLGIAGLILGVIPGIIALIYFGVQRSKISDEIKEKEKNIAQRQISIDAYKAEIEIKDKVSPAENPAVTGTIGSPITTAATLQAQKKAEEDSSPDSSLSTPSDTKAKKLK